MDILIGQLATGLSIGSILLLAALGLSLTFGQMGVINMAHGEFIMAGCYTAYVVQQITAASGMSLLLSLVLGFVVGGLLGVLLGTGGARLVGRLQQWPILITESSVAVAFLFSAAVGMFFGFYPALRASRLNPIDCLRYE